MHIFKSNKIAEGIFFKKYYEIISLAIIHPALESFNFVSKITVILVCLTALPMYKEQTLMNLISVVLQLYYY